ncbi:MAG TPA: response regulator [Candidatus Limnocylindria bacterium]|nr:response regulator [Candidatus Limnocylindria bacterium]
MRVLVADDSEALRAVVRITAESQEWIVLEARTGAETIDLARSQRPELLILDLDFGAGPDGISALAEIRSSSQLRDLPVIVLTGTLDAVQQARAAAMGATVMLKPFSPIDLIGTIRQVLGIELAGDHLGLQLVHEGAVTAHQLERALDDQAAREQDGDRVPLGRVLLEHGAISEDELAAALRAQSALPDRRRRGPRFRAASRVLIVDDSAAVRDGIRALVRTDPSLRTVGEAADALEGLKLARALRPDLILLDNEMPGQRGVDLLPLLRAELPKSRVVVFSMSHSISEQARAQGASAVVSKDGGEVTLLETLRQVRRGDDATTVRLAAFARLRRDRTRLPTREPGVLLAALLGYGIAYLLTEPALGAASAVLGVVSVAIAGALLGPELGVIAAILVIATTWALWGMTGHLVGETVLRVGGGIGALTLLGIGAGSGAFRLSPTHRADTLLAEAIGASAAGGDAFVRTVRSALRCDGAMLFALSNGGRQLRVVSLAGVQLGDERTFVGLPALARSLREARVVVIGSGEDLIDGARVAAFAPIVTEDGAPQGVLAVFYRRAVSFSERDHRLLRAAAIAAEAALAIGPRARPAPVTR